MAAQKIAAAEYSPSLGAWPSASGIQFAVWAPEKSSVEVLLEKPDSRSYAFSLEKNPDGVFTGTHASAQAGDVYRYRLDGEGAYPDPASRFQPQGVHGPSQITDPGGFVWSDAAWSGIPAENLIFYELHVGAFTKEGTFKAVTERLSHLVELGITAIELMPLGDFPGERNWGYDGVDLFAPARCYGAPDDLRRLVDTAHGAGLAVFVDVVYNHFGPNGNYTGVFSPCYLNPRHQTAWGPAINLDGPHSSFVREFFIQNALHWIHEYHMDGLRLDAVHAYKDESPRHFLAELCARVQESAGKRKIHLVAEDNQNLASLIQPQEKGGEGLTAVWSDDFHHQVRRILAGDHDGYYSDFSNCAEDLAVTLNRGWFYSGQYAPFFKAPRGTDPSGLPPERFVFFIQNHDQIGNRALGDRLHHPLPAADYRAASALLLCLPQTPLLFMGQEWAAGTPFLYFTDHAPELGKLVTEGRAKEFASFAQFSSSANVPDPQAGGTFLASKLQWEELNQEAHESVWLFYRALLRWRREELAPGGDFSAAALSPSSLLIQRTMKNGKTALILIHLKGPARLDLARHLDSEKRDALEWEEVLNSEEKAFCLHPHPPRLLLSGEAPVVEFDRPGAVILRERV